MAAIACIAALMQPGCDSDDTVPGPTTTGVGTAGSGGTAGGGGTAGTGGQGGGTGGHAGAGGGPVGCVIYVDGASGSDSASGLSWSQARATVNAGLDAAVAVSCPQVWVAAGSYLPTSGSDRTASITLRPGVALYGGFDGSESSLAQRDVAAHATTLSGDIGVASDSSDNSYHVVVGASDARLDGFTVRAGFADGADDDRQGAGLLNMDSDMTVANCRFESNATGEGDPLQGPIAGGGAGIYHEGGALTVIDSSFVDNVTGHGVDTGGGGTSGGPGAGIDCGAGASLTVTGSTFTGNHTGYGGSSTNTTGATAGGNGGNGAGISFRSEGMLTVTTSTFDANHTGYGGVSTSSAASVGGSGGFGGAIAVTEAATVVIDEVTFDSNVTGNGGVSLAAGIGGSGGPGGGLYARYAVSVVLRNSTFEDNVTGDGAAAAGIGGSGGPGGGAQLIVDLALVSGCTFTSNVVGSGASGSVDGQDGTGGGLDILAEAPVIIASSTFSGHSASWGGGIQLVARTAAGAGPVTLVNNVLYGNHADWEGGGAVYMGDGTGSLDIVNCTFEGNSAGWEGGGFQYRGFEADGSEPANLTNSILWNNSAPDHPNLGSFNGAAINEVMLTVDRCDIEGGCTPPADHQWTCGTTLDIDPGFGNAAAGDHTIGAASPVKDQGLDSYLPPDATDLDGDSNTSEPTPLDRAGNARVGGASVDMGAYEAP